MNLFRARAIAAMLAMILASGAMALPAGAGSEPDSAQNAASSATRSGRGGQSPAGVYKTRITPNWFQNNTRFWYRNDLRGGTREFVMVDAEAGTRKAAFDHQRLAVALSKAAGAQYSADRLPFDTIEFVDDARSIRFTAAGDVWKCDLSSYECSRMGPGPTSGPALSASDHASAALIRTADDELDLAGPMELEDPAPYADPRTQPAGARGGGRGGGVARPARSPNGRWTALIKDQNVYVRGEADGKEVQFSHDGRPDLSYAMLQWAPDSTMLVAFRVEPGDNKEVYLIETSPRGGGRARLQTRPYDLPGDKLTAYELNLFDVVNQKQIKPLVDRVDLGRPNLRWNRDGYHFTYEKTDRGHQRFRIIEVDAHTGDLRNIIDEKSDTFINTAYGGLTRRYLDSTDEIIYTSERDGWKHLYLIDARAGGIKNQITKGEWVVRGVERVDEQGREVWFRASGVYLDQDPYLMHFGRVNFDGSGLTWLTSGNGNHTIAYSPDRKYIIDSYDRVDLPPVHELRRVSDGRLICELEKADVAESAWDPPEVFVAKGRDGQTDIWGIICRPRNLDPGKKYPILEDIYAGPQDSFVPKAFSPTRRYSALTNLGFIVVKIDGMGTANRSKAFHDVCWHNLKDAGFPDRILWMKSVAARYAYMDITRVGVYGTSAGGQNAAGAVLFHPEFYKAAVANSGCHDNRMDKAVWNEQWMGYPVGPWYAESSNIENAAKLQGHLMLVVGELDTNVPPESTYRFVDALIKASKDFDLMVVPGGGHGAGGAYGQRRLQDFFVRHLQGIEPPNRNLASGQTGG